MWFVLFIILLIFIGAFITNQNVKNRKYHLKHDGCCIIKNVLHENDIEKLRKLCVDGDYKAVKKNILNHSSIQKRIHSILNKNYMFQDYIWIIQKSAVHTCHRDNNGDFFNKGQKYPSYTMLLYLEDMEKCLGVIPKSHTNKYSYIVNFNNSVEHLLCEKGDIILFNANLIHVGALNKRHDNIRVQMKLTHKDDVPVLSYYQNFNKVLNKDNTMPDSVLSFQKNISCMFPYISNLTQGENIKSARGTDNGAKVGLGQKIFSYLFYGNSNFYDLPNAF
jgi:ectoine hydroxylase-related dioxygenase (phytanoyl-CoA dioxygenase family)